MGRRCTSVAPTDEEIMGYNNVPVEVAARYIGMSKPTLHRAIREERAPFGFGVECGGGQWSYNISPGLLVKYKHGELPLYKLRQVQELACEGVERILEARLGAVRDTVAGVLRA